MARAGILTCLVACCTALAACGNGEGQVVLTLVFDATIDDATLATISSLAIRASGDETFATTVTLGRPALRTERMIYRPLSSTRSLGLAVDALDMNTALVGTAARDGISIARGKISLVELTLIGPAPGADLGDLAVDDDLAEPVDQAAADLTVTYPSTVLADHPIAYYRLNESSGTVARDSSGHGLDGTYGPGVARTSTGLLGASDGAAVFPGGAWSTNALVLVARDPLLEPTAAVSVECWMKASNGDGSQQPLVAYGPDSSPYEPYLLARSFGQPAAYFSTLGVEPTAMGAITLAADTVYHLVAVYDGATAKVYVNGVLVVNIVVMGAISHYDPAIGLAIGSSYENVSNQNFVFPGVIDEVAIYGAALTAAQIQHHYQVGIGS